MTNVILRIRALVLNFIRLKANSGGWLLCCTWFFPVTLIFLPGIFSVIGAIIYYITYIISIPLNALDNAIPIVDPITLLTDFLAPSIVLEEIQFSRDSTIQGSPVCTSLVSGTPSDFINDEWSRMYLVLDYTGLAGTNTNGSTGLLSYITEGRFRSDTPLLCKRSYNFKTFSNQYEMDLEYQRDISARSDFVNNPMNMIPETRRHLMVSNMLRRRARDARGRVPDKDNPGIDWVEEETFGSLQCTCEDNEVESCMCDEENSFHEEKFKEILLLKMKQEEKYKFRFDCKCRRGQRGDCKCGHATAEKDIEAEKSSQRNDDPYRFKYDCKCEGISDDEECVCEIGDKSVSQGSFYTQMSNGNPLGKGERQLWPEVETGLQPEPDDVKYFGYNGAITFNVIDYELPRIDFNIISPEYKWRDEILHLITNAFINKTSTRGTKIFLGDGSYYYPHDPPSSFLDDFTAAIEGAVDTYKVFQTISEALVLMTFPLCFMFLFPTFAAERVKEKSKGLIEFVELYGVSRLEFEGIRFLFDYTMYMIFLVVAILFPMIFQVTLYVNGNPLMWVPTLFTWGVCMVSAAYCFSMFMTFADTTTAYGLMLIVLSAIIGGLLNVFIFTSIEQPPWYVLLYPPFAFIRCVALIMYDYKTDVIPPNDWFFWVTYFYLLGETIVLTVFFLFFPWIKKTYVFVRVLVDRCFRRIIKTADDDKVIDEDVVLEMENIKKNNLPPNTAIVIHGLRKTFGNLVAVNDVYLSMRQTECFALLGPNGAGKTTLLKLLTGEITHTDGTAKIGTFDLRTSKNSIRQIVSICPQFDTLWDNLNVQDQLLFYTRLRGVPIKKEKNHVEEIIEKVSLGEARRKFAGDLSGGMKRRLMLGCALAGNPQIVLMDEPTTGLDPNTKRSIWEIVTKVKKEKCIVLTTHSMHEAEVLSDRIGIMTNGRLRCLGDLPSLKKKFSMGYQMIVQCRRGSTKTVDSYIRKILPKISDHTRFADMLYYRIPGKSCKISKIFQQMNPIKAKQYGVLDWTLNPASLEEVFLKLAKESYARDEGEDVDDVFEKREAGDDSDDDELVIIEEPPEKKSPDVHLSEQKTEVELSEKKPEVNIEQEVNIEPKDDDVVPPDF